jgi:uncharacterized protein
MPAADDPPHLTGHATRLTIFVSENDHHGRHPLYTEIVQRARDAGLAGATVLRGLEGFGASHVVHTTRLLSMSEDLPVVVTIIDRDERIEAFLPTLDELVTDGLVVREVVEVYRHTSPTADPDG